MSDGGSHAGVGRQAWMRLATSFGSNHSRSREPPGAAAARPGVDYVLNLKDLKCQVPRTR